APSPSPTPSPPSAEQHGKNPAFIVAQRAERRPIEFARGYCPSEKSALRMVQRAQRGHFVSAGGRARPKSPRSRWSSALSADISCRRLVVSVREVRADDGPAR